MIRASVLIGSLFALSGGFKALSIHEFQEAVQQFPIPAVIKPIILVVVPTLELAIAIVLFGFKNYRRKGLAIAGMLLAIFALFHLYLLWFGIKVDCVCVPVLRMGHLGWLALNITFMLLAFLSIRPSHSKSVVIQ